MSRTLPILVLALVGALAAVWWVAGEREPPGSAAPVAGRADPPLASRAASDPERPAAPRAGRAAGREAPGPEPRPRAARAPIGAPAAAAPAAWSRDLRVLALELDDRSVSGLDGWLELELPGLDREPRRVEVAGGWFTLEAERAPEAEWLELSARGELGGRRVATLRPARVSLDPEAAGTLVLSFLAALRLSVRDAATGVDLPAVHVVRERPGARSSDRHPGVVDGEQVVVGPVPSPLTLHLSPDGGRRRQVDLFVRAEGYAWQPLRVDPLVEDSRVLELGPGGTVVARPEGVGDAEGLTVRFREAAGALLCEAPVAGDGPLRFDGLPAGVWRAALERGADDNGFELVGADVTVTAGGWVELPLVVPAQARGAAPTFDPLVSVRVPAAWHQGAIVAGVLPVEARLLLSSDGREWFQHQTLELTSNQDGALYTGRFEDAPPGVFRLQLSAPPSTFGFELVDGRPLHFDLPAPRELVVRTFDGETGEPTDPQFLLVTDPRSGGSAIASSEELATGVRRLRLAVDRATLLVGTGQSIVTRQVELTDDVTEVRVRLGEQPELTLRFVADGRPLEPPSSYAPSFEHLDGDRAGERILRSGLGSEQTFWFSAPGRYRVNLDPIPGFEPLEPFEVELRTGEPVTREVEPVRKL